MRARYLFRHGFVRRQLGFSSFRHASMASLTVCW
jgi:hypothetical protein